jgi:hypothetical protein
VMQDADVEDSTLQLVIDQLEELVVTIVEEIRERPGVVLAIGAALIGAFVGTRLAAKTGHRRASPPARVARRAQKLGEVAELAGIGVRLLQNPIVRTVMVSAIERQMKRRLPL